MKRIFIRLLDVAAWILRIIIAPLRIIMKLVWPSTTPEEETSLELGGVQAQARELVQAQTAPSITSTPHKVISPASQPIQAAVKVKPGWFSLPLENLPHPTYWPVVLGLGLIFGVFGVVTSFVFSLVGIFLFILGLAGWIGDMWNEQEQSE